MIIKVCGIKHQDNADALSALSIDMLGLNFYPASSRYLSRELNVDPHIKKVGVFVNAPLDEVRKKIEKHKLDYVQCHGGESTDYCLELQREVKLIKVFSISNKEDFDQTRDFDFCDSFLFDTKTKSHGGSGVKFNWNLLSHYEGSTPFLLAGGISPNDLNDLKDIRHSSFAGVDINSKFETEPGRKDKNLIEHFIKNINA